MSTKKRVKSTEDAEQVLEEVKTTPVQVTAENETVEETQLVEAMVPDGTVWDAFEVATVRYKVLVASMSKLVATDRRGIKQAVMTDLFREAEDLVKEQQVLRKRGIALNRFRERHERAHTPGGSRKIVARHNARVGSLAPTARDVMLSMKNTGASAMAGKMRTLSAATMEDGAYEVAMSFRQEEE